MACEQALLCVLSHACPMDVVRGRVYQVRSPAPHDRTVDSFAEPGTYGRDGLTLGRGSDVRFGSWSCARCIL
jgi:hypothetical protein